MTEHNEIQLYAVRAEADRLKSEIERAMTALTHALRENSRNRERMVTDLTRIRSERDAVLDAAIKLCVHGQPQDHQAEEWRNAARIISGIRATLRGSLAEYITNERHLPSNALH
jgi:hypothetical protein